MKYIKKNLVLMIAGFVLNLSAASAMAATIDAGVDLNVTRNDVSIPFQKAQLAQFDSSLGELTGVSLFLEGTYSSTLTLNNKYPQQLTAISWSIEPYSMEIKSQILPDTVVEQEDKVTKSIYLEGPGTISTDAPILRVNQTYAFEGSDLNAFTGPGFVDFYFGSASKDFLFIFSAYGDPSLSVKSIFTGSIRAAYSYTPAPLPSALIFLLSGLAGITGFRKFRDRASV